MGGAQASVRGAQASVRGARPPWPPRSDGTADTACVMYFTNDWKNVLLMQGLLR